MPSYPPAQPQSPHLSAWRISLGICQGICQGEVHRRQAFLWFL